MANHKIKYFIITLLITVLVIAPVFCIVFNKDSIHESTYEELVEINGIGDTLAIRVLSYLDSNKTCCIEDLDDIKGIGEGKLELIKRKYGD